MSGGREFQSLQWSNDRKSPFTQGRIQEFILEGAKPVLQSKVEGEARNEGAKRPRIEDEA